jgi:hypothetical protein
MSETVLTLASRQWASRPDDQRFAGDGTTDGALTELHTYVAERTRLSDHFLACPRNFTVEADPWDESNPTNLGGLWINASGAKFLPTHHSFGQMCSLVKAGADSLRTLPGQIAADVLRFRFLSRDEAMAPSKFLVTANAASIAAGEPYAEVRAATGPDYGYISDLRVVNAVMSLRAHNPAWSVPLKAYNGVLNKMSTTLYAGDRDIFMLLVDESRPIEVNGETLFRFFIVSNSETGSGTFRVMTGFYRMICANRCIWGAADIKEISIRHTKNAPERFQNEFEREVIPVLAAYTESSTKPFEAQVSKSMATVPVLTDGKRAGQPVETVEDAVFFLQTEVPLLSERAATAAVHLADTEMGGHKTIWELLNGATAYARGIPHQDHRTKVEAQASTLLSKFAAIG